MTKSLLLFYSSEGRWSLWDYDNLTLIVEGVGRCDIIKLCLDYRKVGCRSVCITSVEVPIWEDAFEFIDGYMKGLQHVKGDII